MAIPSQAPTENSGGEGVETRRAAPTAERLRPNGHGEGIVQTTNSPERHSDALSGRAAKAVVGKKIRWGASPVRVQVPPPAPYRHKIRVHLELTFSFYSPNMT